MTAETMRRVLTNYEKLVTNYEKSWLMSDPVCPWT